MISDCFITFKQKKHCETKTFYSSLLIFYYDVGIFFLNASKPELVIPVNIIIEVKV